MAQMAKNPSASGRPGFNPWVGKIPWRREWLPTPVFWPGELHGQRSLEGYSPWSHKESDTAEQTSLYLKLHLRNYLKRDSPSGPVVKILCFHCQGCGFDLWLGNEDPNGHAMRPPRQIFNYLKKTTSICFFKRISIIRAATPCYYSY